MIDLYRMTADSPRNYGVPHNTWRPNQYKMFKEIEKVSETGGGFVIAELGTGSGKSAIATAMGHNDKVLVVVHTLGLLDQYEKLYEFAIIKGRQEYDCANEEKISEWKEFKIIPTAIDCTYSPMHKCPYSDQCDYIVAKNIAINAQRSACTYRYVGVSRLMKQREGNIVLDEAHDAAEELIRFNEFSYLNNTLKKYNIPKFPIVGGYGVKGKGAILAESDRGKIEAWLSQSAISLYIPDEDIKGKAATQQRKMHDRFKRMLTDLYTVDWFLQLGKGKISFKALDAVAVANRVFAHKSTKILMSATIGNPKPLADALGITDYKFLSFDHPIPTKYRSVKNLEAPRMTARNLRDNDELYKEQAKLIWNWIMKMPSSWRGVILTTSYKKIGELYRHLIVPTTIAPTKRRVFHQKKGQKVSDLVNNFITDVKPGDIMIGTIQGWGSGLDLRGNLARWIVIAGVPHTNPTDEYAKARRAIAGGIAYQYWVTFNAVMQACGRVSRGEVDDTGDWLANYAALADGSAVSPTAFKYYGDWFKKAVV